jgi:putative colanic acid biosynthesis UDP-glucose lipid carrier transferase
MRTRLRILLYFVLDLGLLNASAWIVSVLRAKNLSSLFSDQGKIILLINLAWLVSYLVFIDDVRQFKTRLRFMIQRLIRMFVLFIAILASGLILMRYYDFSHRILFGSIGIFFAFKLFVSLWTIYIARIDNQPNMRPAIIIGNNSIGISAFQYLQKHTHFGLQPLGILDFNLSSAPNNSLLGSFDDFQRIYDRQPFQDVLIALPLSENARIKMIIDRAERNGVRPHIIPNYFGLIDRAFHVETMGDLSFITYRRLPLDSYPNRFWKRAFDMTLALIALVLLLPILLLIALAIKLESRGPVFYRPVRLGVNSLPFTVYKFRSMRTTGGDKAKDSSTTVNDERITRVGKFLRKLNLDELPQLINVLNNEMSLVGPRPHRQSLNDSMQHKLKAYRVRHLVKPGITGWAQVNGYRGPMENRVQYAGRTLHDLWYLEHWSFWLDLYILLLTVISKKAYQNAF